MTKVKGTLHDYSIAPDNTEAAKVKYENENEKHAIISKLVCKETVCEDEKRDLFVRQVVLLKVLRRFYQ